MLLLYLPFVAYVSVGFVSSQRELVYVQAVWRHGDRAPLHLPYPKDLNTEDAWPRGWGQLTNLGIKELYDLGQFFSRRYFQLINNKFTADKVMVTSTNSDRTIVSAQAFLRGMFPAGGADRWLDGESWQPIPFYTRTFGDTDAMLRPTDWECELYYKVLEEQNEQIFDDLEEEYAEFFDFLQNVTGFSNVDLNVAASLSNIQREIIHNLPQPNWVYRRWPAHGNKMTLEIIIELQRIRMISNYNSPEKARLRGGLLLDDWVSRVVDISNGEVVKPTRMNLYSAHDSTLLALMYAMGIGNNALIPYAACLIMEVYETLQNNTEVKLLYRNQTYSDIVHTMVIPGCEEFCSVDNFSTLLSSNALSSEEELDQVCCGE